MGWAISRKGLSTTSKLVLIILADRADKDGWSFYSQETIADIAGCTRKTARAALQALEQDDLIRRCPRSVDGMRTSDHIQIGPSCRWVKNTQVHGQKLPTIPTSPYGVGIVQGKKKKNSQPRSGLRLVGGRDS